MRKTFGSLAILLLVGVLPMLLGCGRKEKAEEPSGAAPRSEEKPITTGQKPEVAKAGVVLTCGMAGHPEFQPGKEPPDGKCPKCGMKLTRKEVAARSYWTCPMHPEVRQNNPGVCPKCGMKLVEKQAVPGKTE